MLGFFRKIRGVLIMEGKSSRYALYAIGEILLVVIGILLALEINNWAIDKEKRVLEKKYIVRLISDLKADQKRMNASRNRAELNYQYSHQIHDFLNGKEHKFDNDKHLLLAMQLVGRVRGIQFRTNTFDDLISTGNMVLIREQLLSDQILSYYRTLPMDWLNTYSKRTVDDYLPLPIEAIPLDTHIDIMEYEQANRVSTIEDYQIMISPAQVQQSLQWIKESERFPFQLKNVSRSHLFHLSIVDSQIKKINKLKASLSSYLKDIE